MGKKHFAADKETPAASIVGGKTPGLNNETPAGCAPVVVVKKRTTKPGQAAIREIKKYLYDFLGIIFACSLAWEINFELLAHYAWQIFNNICGSTRTLQSMQHNFLPGTRNLPSCCSESCRSSD